MFDLAVDQICNLLEKPDPENGQYGDYSSLASVYIYMPPLTVFILRH